MLWDPMSRVQPYQPLLLRLLHGVNGFLILAAIVTGALVYNRFDGRWGKLDLTVSPVIIDIHGTIGLILLFIFAVFALYSFYFGKQRLIQDNVGDQLRQVNRPQWWNALQRILNTLMLIAVTFSLLTGRFMKEDWLKDRDLNHLAYTLHLSGWVVLVLGIVLHVLLGLKVGGMPLILSMYSPEYRGTREAWPWQKKTVTRETEPLRRKNVLLLLAQVLVAGGFITALSAPLWSSGEEEDKDEEEKREDRSS